LGKQQKNRKQSVTICEHIGVLQLSVIHCNNNNNTSNSIGPVLALWGTFKYGNVLLENAVDPWIIAYGCLGIVFGLWILGRRVIETVGEDIAEITPAR